MRIVIRVNEQREFWVADLDVEAGSLAVLQQGVDGYVEVVDISENLSMWMNEEGKFRSDFTHNELATRLLHEAGGAEEDFVMGPVVFSGAPDEDGETRGLDGESALRILGLLVSEVETDEA